MIEPQLTCPAGVSYDDAAHAYRLDGKAVPSVSAILKVVQPDLYENIAEDILQRACERGNNGHAMIALDVRDDLDYLSLEGQLLDHWEAWDRFRNDYRFDCEYSERIVASRNHRYCGAIDLIGKIKHKRKPGRWQVDIKFTSSKPSLVAIQTAGYNIAASETLPNYDVRTPRGCLWITGNKYSFIELPDAMDRAVFISGKTIYNWRMQQ
jgi:hypothetical protein